MRHPSSQSIWHSTICNMGISGGRARCACPATARAFFGQVMAIQPADLAGSAAVFNGVSQVGDLEARNTQSRSEVIPEHYAQFGAGFC